MTETQQNGRQADGDGRAQDFDAVIIGAGFAGLYMLHKLRDGLGLSARVVGRAWRNVPGQRRG